MIVCENCIHRYVCEDKYTMKPQYACINYNSGKHIFIAELENIKEEIKPLPITDTAIRLISETIDKHISELKEGAE